MRLRRITGPVLALMALASAAVAAPAAPARPNVLLIVADDLGFSDLGAFGGEIQTPNLDALAQAGVRMTGFHTAPTCSPTRSMLLTGADNHQVGLGSMAESLTPAQQGQPGYEGYLNQRAATLAEILAASGYQTLMAGKWHLGLEESQSPKARGFQQSFALLQGLQNHFGDNQDDAWAAVGEKATFRENGRLATYPKGVYSADYFADRLIGFLKTTRQDQPFFAYLTFTEPHWPLQAPPEVIAKYKGRYDAGPEALRQARLKRQQELGLAPAGAAPHPIVDAPVWESLTPDQQALESRKMEIYAAMVDRLDQNVGRLLQALRERGQLDNTVVIFISDNGPEGTVINGPRVGRAGPPNAATAALKVDNSLGNLGRSSSYVGYGPAWAQAASAPLRLMKGYTTEGGIRTPAFVSGAGVAGGRISDAFLHVKDITPTVLELAGVASPDTFQGRPVLKPDGHSWAGLLRGAGPDQVRPDTEVVGWELFYRRGVRQGDWKAVFLPRGPDGAYSRTAGAAGSWELFNLKTDPAEIHDLAAVEPERLKALVAAWNAYAQRAGVAIPPPLASAGQP